MGPSEEWGAALLAWYRRHRRDLPWRRSRDPYGVWISEAMLQQTRVETVIPYWERFLESFPTVAALAAASEDEVLAHWSGLGYYRRARALHAAARAIVETRAETRAETRTGEFPRTRAEMLALPGVGPYTAGAVLSIAFDQPEPVVDGNVTRVFARLFGLEGTVGSGGLERELWAIARRLVPERGAGDWNQAVMELGATVCLPREAHCHLCPLAGECRAREQGRVAELPRQRPKRAPVDVELVTVIVRKGSDMLLERRPDAGRMAGMWQFPTAEPSGPDGRSTDLFPAALPGGLQPLEPLGAIRHGITHHRIRVTVHAGRFTAEAQAPLAWIGTDDVSALPLTGMTKKILRAQAMLPAGQRP